MLISFLYILFFQSLSGNVTHDIHVSVIEIEYNAEADSYQMAAKIFVDDLQSALILNGSDSLFLFEPNEIISADEAILGYINKHVKINTRDNAQPWVWVGKELSEDLAATWCYLEMPNVSDHSAMELDISVLMDLYEDQQNIVKIKAFGEQYHHLLSSGDTAKSISFD